MMVDQMGVAEGCCTALYKKKLDEQIWASIRLERLSPALMSFPGSIRVSGTVYVYSTGYTLICRRVKSIQLEEGEEVCQSSRPLNSIFVRYRAGTEPVQRQNGKVSHYDATMPPKMIT
ncbi:MAG: hypothetical protein K940chlam2_00889 [Chlamydiae bacterium]|nr:hypothetical protein [Chlamydiota bacterium]